MHCTLCDIEDPPFVDDTATSIIRRYGWLKKSYPHLPELYDCACCNGMVSDPDAGRKAAAAADVLEIRAKGSQMGACPPMIAVPRKTLTAAVAAADAADAAALASAYRTNLIKLCDEYHYRKQGPAPMYACRGAAPPPRDIAELKAQSSRNARMARRTPCTLTLVVHRGLKLTAPEGTLLSVLVRCGQYEGQTVAVKRRKNKALIWGERFMLPIVWSGEAKRFDTRSGTDGSLDNPPLEIYILTGRAVSETVPGACIAAARVDNLALHNDTRGLRERVPLYGTSSSAHLNGDVQSKDNKKAGLIELSWHIVDGASADDECLPEEEDDEDIPVESEPKSKHKKKRDPSKLDIPVALRMNIVKATLQTPSDNADRMRRIAETQGVYVTLHKRDGSCSDAATLYRDGRAVVTQLQRGITTAEFLPAVGCDGQSTGLIEEDIGDRLIQLLCCLRGKDKRRESQQVLHDEDGNFVEPETPPEADAPLVLDVVGAVTLDMTQLQGAYTEGSTTLTLTSKGHPVGEVLLSWSTEQLDIEARERAALEEAEKEQRRKALAEERERRRRARRDAELKQAMMKGVEEAAKSVEEELAIGPDEEGVEQPALGLCVTVIRGVGLVGVDGKPLIRPRVSVAVGPMEAATYPLTEEKFEINEFSSDEDKEGEDESTRQPRVRARCQQPRDVVWNQEMRFFDIADESGLMPSALEVFLFDDGEEGSDPVLVSRCIAYGETPLTNDVTAAAVVNVYATPEEEQAHDFEDGGMTRPCGQVILKFRWDSVTNMMAAMAAENQVEAQEENAKDKADHPVKLDEPDAITEIPFDGQAVEPDIIDPKSKPDAKSLDQPETPATGLDRGDSALDPAAKQQHPSGLPTKLPAPSLPAKDLHSDRRSNPTFGFSTGAPAAGLGGSDSGSSLKLKGSGSDLATDLPPRDVATGAKDSAPAQGPATKEHPFTGPLTTGPSLDLSAMVSDHRRVVVGEDGDEQEGPHSSASKGDDLSLSKAKEGIEQKKRDFIKQPDKENDKDLLVDEPHSGRPGPDSAANCGLVASAQDAVGIGNHDGHEPMDSSVKDSKLGHTSAGANTFDENNKNDDDDDDAQPNAKPPVPISRSDSDKSVDKNGPIGREEAVDFRGGSLPQDLRAQFERAEGAGRDSLSCERDEDMDRLGLQQRQESAFSSLLQRERQEKPRTLAPCGTTGATAAPHNTYAFSLLRGSEGARRRGIEESEAADWVAMLMGARRARREIEIMLREQDSLKVKPVQSVAATESYANIVFSDYESTEIISPRDYPRTEDPRTYAADLELTLDAAIKVTQLYRPVLRLFPRAIPAEEPVVEITSEPAEERAACMPPKRTPRTPRAAPVALYPWYPPGKPENDCHLPTSLKNNVIAQKNNVNTLALQLTALDNQLGKELRQQKENATESSQGRRSGSRQRRSLSNAPLDNVLKAISSYHRANSNNAALSTKLSRPAAGAAPYGRFHSYAAQGTNDRMQAVKPAANANTKAFNKNNAPALNSRLTEGNRGPGRLSY